MTWNRDIGHDNPPVFVRLLRSHLVQLLCLVQFGRLRATSAHQVMQPKDELRCG